MQASLLEGLPEISTQLEQISRLLSFGCRLLGSGSLSEATAGLPLDLQVLIVDEFLNGIQDVPVLQQLQGQLLVSGHQEVTRSLTVSPSGRWAGSLSCLH